jgi:CheY-like chemotaxis protein
MGKCVLIVDDDPEVRDAIRAMLETYGYTVREAGDAHEAGRAIEAERPDLILTDIYMPAGDGFELMTAVREDRSRIPIVAMSGRNQDAAVDYLDLARKMGAVGIIDKPFRASNLLEMIDRAIAGRGAPARR